jgi:hypothetical protein
LSSRDRCGLPLNRSGGNDPCGKHPKPLYNLDEDNLTCR